MGDPSRVRWNALRQEVEQILRDFFETRHTHTPEASLELPMDIYDLDGEIILEVELPGIAKNSIDLNVLRDILIVEGNKERDQAPAREHLCAERSFGRFRRVVEIPVAGDTSNIKAEYDRGVLRIHLPRIEERRGQRRRVSIV